MPSDRRWLMPGLFVSILINLFLLGIFAGHVFDRYRQASPKGAGPLVPPQHVRALPADERKLFAKAMAPHRAEIKAAREEQQRLRRTTEEDIAAPTFDRAKVAADFKALRDGQASVQEKIQNGLLDALQNLSGPSRAALVHHEADSTDKVSPPPK